MTDADLTQPAAVPLIELLRRIPADARYTWETDDNGFKAWHSSPVGKHCHDAAAHLEQETSALTLAVEDVRQFRDRARAAEAERDRLREALEELRDDMRHSSDSGFTNSGDALNWSFRIGDVLAPQPPDPPGDECDMPGHGYPA